MKIKEHFCKPELSYCNKNTFSLYLTNFKIFHLAESSLVGDYMSSHYSRDYNMHIQLLHM